MLRWRTVLAACLGALMIANLASAASIGVTASVVRYLRCDDRCPYTIGRPLQWTAAHLPGQYIWNRHRRFSTEAYGGVAYSIGLTGGVSRNTVTAPGAPLSTPKPNYAANNPPMTNVVDGTTFANVTQTFTDNSDFGDGTDLVGITTAIDATNLNNLLDATTFNPAPDPRFNIGKSSPFLLGAIYVKGNGTADGQVLVKDGSYSIASSATHNLSNTVPFGTFTLAIPATAIPEPASIALMGLGAFGLIGVKLRRRSA